MVNLIINNTKIEVPEDTTILEAAATVNVNIPTLCHVSIDCLNIEKKTASCRICVVEVEGRRNLAPSCCTPVSEGMVVKTNSIRAINGRRTMLDLLLSDHPKDCLTCDKNGNCRLQELASEFDLHHLLYDGEQSTHPIDLANKSIVRDPSKCIMCRRCEVACNEIQTVGVLSATGRGFNAVVTPAGNLPLDETKCTFCGQCVATCPVGALTEINNKYKVWQFLDTKDKHVIVQTAPAVRVAIGEEFGMEPGSIGTGKLVSALRKIGFDAVFDTDFAADLTIMEETTEFINRVKENKNLPILTSCCPGWVKFFEHQFPELIYMPSTAKSPQQMFGAIAKSYYAEKLGKKPEDIIVVSVMPCLAKKYEASRDEFAVNGDPDVNISITTRELAQMIKNANLKFTDLPDDDFDRPMGESTGAGVIFGTTGGVIEAAVRTAYELHTGKELDRVEFEELRGMEGIRSATIDFDGLPINIGIAHGLGNARKLLNDIKEGKSEFHAIEIMACPGGCIGGGGQPYHHGDVTVLKKRQKAIYEEDKGKAIRKSHENPYIQKLYTEFLGEPCGSKSHELLHTHYFDKKKKIEI
jgi:NADP-reducing hydrogenase subunit HndD